MATQTTLVTFDQFMDLPEQEGVRLELDEGIVIEMAQPSFSHGAIQVAIAASLDTYLAETGADFALSQNTGFRLAPDTVRAPDVCLVRTSSLEAMTVVRGAQVGAPDLAVEVVSPSDTARDLNRRVEQYLKAGATAVWVFYNETQTVIVYRRSGETHRLTEEQFLEEPSLLPGLRISLEKVFHRPGATMPGSADR